MSQQVVSVVIPAYNEAGAIEPVYRAAGEAIEQAGFNFEIIFVNDGSRDGTDEEVAALHEKDHRVKLINLSRNFGQHVAVTAGLEHASGSAVILMDCDLQDDPSTLPRFIQMWQEGYDVVYALRTDRKENFLKRLAFSAFHRVNHALSEIHVPSDAGLFCIMSRRVIDELNRFKERNRYLPGLRFWVGFKQTGIQVPRLARYDDKPRVSFSRLVLLSMDSLISSSKVPLRLATFLGFLMFCFAAVLSAYVIYSKYISFKAIPGWASEVGLILFFGSTQFIILGILGEYIARIYDEVKMRPLYIVETKLGAFGFQKSESE
ncbi:MAG: glycosyltransferase family 2 protein [bacterium]|nr:glycosyltransferase family 2 protein [bacterium]